MKRNYTVEMNNGHEVYYPAAAVRGGGDFTSDKAGARPMTEDDAGLMVERVSMFSAGVTARVVPLHSPATQDAAQLIDLIKHGARVTIVTPQNQERTGTAVMRGPHGWVLNMGGAHGTPAVATARNITAVRVISGRK